MFKKVFGLMIVAASLHGLEQDDEYFHCIYLAGQSTTSVPKVEPKPQGVMKDTLQ